MNSLTRIMSYDKTKVNQENCDCKECVGIADVSEKKEIFGNFKYADDFFIKVKNYWLICREHEILNTMNLEYWYKDTKTKNFIWKSLHVHGDKYIYHKTKVVKVKEKTWFECRNGHCFEQRPHDHKNGHGCSKCGKTAVLTQDEFIKKANEIHGEGRYDYSKSIYYNMNKKVCIICNNHESPFEFWQSPHQHLKGQGCPKCYKSEKLTTEKFIERAKIIHGDKYDYSEVNYINYHTKVCIICKHHKKVFKFWQTPHNHLIGNGCPKCNSSKGEIAIRNFLINNEINFEEQKSFKDCKYKKLLKFDFYIFDHNLCIEYDGRQHFKINHFKFKMSKEEKIENFKLIQLRDQIKNDYCEKNGINLLRIRYDENVEEKLTEYFQKHGIIKEQTLFEMVS